MDDRNILRFNDIEGVDGVDCRGAEQAYAVEQVANNVFLCQPAIFLVVVQSSVRERFQKDLLLCAVPGLNWDHKVLYASKNEINSLRQTENLQINNTKLVHDHSVESKKKKKPKRKMSRGSYLEGK